MRIYAYEENYLAKAQSLLGSAFDYAVNICKINSSDFIKMFALSSYGERIEKGDFSVIAGMSGEEMVRGIIYEIKGEEIETDPVPSFTRSPDYWIGWAVAYYQWYSDRKFKEIFACVKYEELNKMYFTLHEADISKFSDIMDERINKCFCEKNLKRLRKARKLSQSALSEKAGVSLRSIQMYEQGKKDINKAKAATLYRISKILSCSIEDLLEK